jgi:probable rRNA maturation factor
MKRDKTQSHVIVSCHRAGNRVDPRTIRRRCARSLGYLGKTEAEVSILLCDDALIRDLNREYRHLDRPTDVLSFSMSEGEVLEGDSHLLGDIVISVETAARQAAELNRTMTEEVTSLMVHGLLHLLGYDHQLESEEEEMQRLAREVESFVTKRSHSETRSFRP